MDASPQLNQVMEALRRADAAGNHDDAIKLAQIANRLRGQQSTEKAAPKPDTSFSSALQSGLDAPLENLGDTATMMGAPGIGKFLKDLTQAPENYQPAQVVDQGSDKPWYDPRAYNYSELPRAAVEQAGQFGGALATRAGGAAVGGMAGPAGAVAGTFAGPALFEGLQVVGPVAKKLAQSKGLDAPRAAEWAQAAATAFASGALNSIIPDARLLRPFTEALTEAGQSVVEQAGSSAGTPEGTSVDLKQAIGEGLSAGGAAGAFGIPHAAKEVIVSPVREARVRSQMGRARDNPEHFAAELRTIQGVENDSGQVVGESRPTEQYALVRNLWKDSRAGFKNAVDALYDDGSINRDQRDALTRDADAVLVTAGNHTQELREMDLDRIRDLNISDESKKVLVNAAVDMNLQAQAAKEKNQRGPFEEVARRITTPAARAGATIAGAASGNIPLLLAAGVSNFVLPRAGAWVDKIAGLKRPEVLRKSEAKKEAAKRLGINPGDTRADLQNITNDARDRLAQIRIRAQQQQDAIDPNKLREYQEKLNDEGVNRLGGWSDAAIEHGSKAAGAKVTWDDLISALEEQKSYGLISQAKFDDLRFNRGTPDLPKSLYYLMQDRAAHFAAQREGKAGLERREQQLDAAKQGRREAAERSRAVVADQKEIDEENRQAAAVARQIAAIERLARTKGIDPQGLDENQVSALEKELAKARSEASRKAAETRRAKVAGTLASDGPPTHGGPGNGSGNGIRNPIAYANRVNDAKVSFETLMESAPKELRGVIQLISNEKSKVVKKALVKMAKVQHPDHADYIDDVLGAFSKIGGK